MALTLNAGRFKEYFIRDRKTCKTRLYAFRHVFHHKAACLFGGTSNVRSYYNILQL